MKPKELNFEEGRLFEDRLSKLLNPQNPLYKMSKAVPWEALEKALATPSKVGDQTLWNDIYGTLPPFRRRQFN